MGKAEREAIREAVEAGDMTPQQAAKELGGGIAQWAADYIDGK
jgi:hypothetical protein